MSEYLIQAKLIMWCRSHSDRRLHNIYAHTNGMRSSVTEGVKQKRAGAVAGLPDLFLPVMSGGWGGLYVELKTEKGKLSAIQRDWLGRLSLAGYKAVVAFGLEQAKAVIEEYLVASSSQQS